LQATPTSHSNPFQILCCQPQVMITFGVHHIPSAHMDRNTAAVLTYKGYVFTDYTSTCNFTTVAIATFQSRSKLSVGVSKCTLTQMSGLTLVSEGSDSLAELQRAQRLLHWRCYRRGCRTIKSSLFNLPWSLKP